jgi:hypothetical protein
MGNVGNVGNDFYNRLLAMSGGSQKNISANMISNKKAPQGGFFASNV